MEFMNLWPFFLLLLIPVIILLYLLRQKTEDKTFSSLYLWREAYKNTEAAKPWEKFRNNLLMYLQIAVVLALILALAAPYLKTGGTRSAHVILVVDSSASMNTRYDDKYTRFEQAVREAGNYIDSLADGTAVTILTADDNTDIKGANITDKVELRRILAEITCSDLAGNMQKAVAYSASIASQWEDYEALFFTDTYIDLGELNGKLVNVNSEVSNACIDYVGVSQDGEEMIVLVKVSNTASGHITSDVSFYIDDVLTDIKSVSLGEGESTILYFEGLQAEGEVVCAQLSQKDGLISDNVSYAVIKETREITALLVTGQNTFLETAVSLVEGVTFYKTGQMGDLEGENFDLYLFDGVVPETLPNRGNLIFINPPQGFSGLFEIEEVLEHKMISAVPHDVTHYLENASFGVVKASALVTALSKESFLKAGNSTIGLCREVDGRKIAVLGFDFHDTDFPLQAEFPILMYNLISYTLEQGIIRQSIYQTGDTMTLYPEPDGGPIRVRYPDGQEETWSSEEDFSWQITLPSAGLYTVSQTVGNNSLETGKSQLAGIVTEYAAVRFPVQQESYATAWEEADHTEVITQAGQEGTISLRSIFLLLAILLLCMEWGIYVRSR